MIYHTTTYSDVVESFLLGLSCLVGGDQFYIFISQTEASPKTQSYIAITAVLATLFLAIIFYDDYNASLFDLFHVIYLIMLMIWISVLYQKVKDRFITTIYTSILAMVLTFLIILCCIHYSHRKDLLHSFLSGLLFARLLPSLIWTFLKEKKPEYEDNLSTLSMRLALFRVLFCVGSIMIKITSGNLGFDEIKIEINKPYDWHIIRTHSSIKLVEQFIKLFKDRKGSFKFNDVPLNFLIFAFTIVLYLGLPPILHGFSHLYSHHLYSTIDIIRSISNLFGVALGMKYPVSKTTNSYYYTGISLFYLVYVWCLGFLNYFFTIRSQVVLRVIVILTGCILGYSWSYSLVIIINIFLLPTCIYEENKQGACCGDKINNQCYCKLEQIGENYSKDYKYKMFECSKLLFKDKKGYSENSECAILLISDANGSVSQKVCEGCCKIECKCNSGCEGKCCLKVKSIYKLDAVTVSSCSDCQLTIRLEGTCSCGPGQCAKCCGSGGPCVCENGKCCCLCVKCCTPDCGSNNGCCCIHFCKKCDLGKCKCHEKDCEKGVRLFIYLNVEKKCCIKEIKTNHTPFFDGDLRKLNEFYITNITISDCCHVDLRIDLHCTMKNNFFRLTPIDYQNKSIKPLQIMLSRDDTDCSKITPSNCCCCEKLGLSKVLLQYENGQDLKKACVFPKNCKSTCTCCKTGKCCCFACVIFYVHKLSSFYWSIGPVRVKLVLILWFFVLIFLVITISATSRVKNKSLKYYELFPIRSFETVTKEVEKNDLNSMHMVLQRLRSAQEGIFLEVFGEKDKKHDLDHMLQLCKCAFDTYSFNKLKHYVLSQSSMLIASPQYVNRRLDLELVKWSYCVGFVHTYITMMFFAIQDYFLKWEHVWVREYLNYRKTITGKFNKITQSSKFSISLMCEVDVNQKTIVYLNKTRKGDWGCAFDEIDRYTNLYDKEEELSKSPPYRMDLRLMYFLDRWDHRIESIKFWIQNKTNIYDWKGLLKEYPKIRKWFFNFRSHIYKTSIEMNLPVEELNRGTEILEGKLKS